MPNPIDRWITAPTTNAATSATTVTGRGAYVATVGPPVDWAGHGQAVLLAHLRVPDERARLRAHRGTARGRRHGADRRPRRRRCRRAQYLLHSRERRQQAV